MGCSQKARAWNEELEAGLGAFLEKKAGVAHTGMGRVRVLGVRRILETSEGMGF